MACDGFDDLCLGAADESDCSLPPYYSIVPAVFVVAATALMVGAWLEVKRREKNEGECQEVSIKPSPDYE